MKIKRFFSNDMRSVIRMVREELGPDAVILSNSRVNGGIEVVAAVDYDESIFNAEANAETSDKNEVANVSVASAQMSQKQSHQQLQKATSRPGNQKRRTSRNANEQTTSVDSITEQNSNQPGAASQYTNQFDELSSEQKKKSDFSFYLLGDDEGDQSPSIEQSLYDTSYAHADAYADSSNTAVKNDGQGSVWSQEPTLVEIRGEMKMLRSLLEKQLSGLAWGDFAGKNPVKAKLLRQLLELELHPKLAGKIADAAENHQDYDKAWQYSLSLLANQLPTKGDDIISKGGIVSLVGPTGVGKTTTVAKLAARYALRHGRNKVALVTTDSFRIGAHEQLRTYGRILGMPVRVSSTQEELVEILQGFSDKELILIDTAGMSHRDIRLIEQFSMISDSAPSIKSLLVMSATTHRAGLDEIVRVFKNVELDGCVITKIDETTNLAGSLSVAIDRQLPIAYIGNGQKVPEDLHLARAHSLVNQSVLIARKTNQPLESESLEMAFSRVTSNSHV